MNCAKLFLDQAHEYPGRAALIIPGKSKTTFGELCDISERTRSMLLHYDIKKGDTVLVFDELSPNLYGLLIGLMSAGVGAIFIEPWLAIDKINRILEVVKPRAFLSNNMGFMWGCRAQSIRQIPRWIRTSSVLSHKICNDDVVDVEAATPGIITFTTGTTGLPKGMVRSHGYLIDQHRVLEKNLHASANANDIDLVVFANFVFANLASGRTSVLLPSPWKERYLRALSHLPAELSPTSLTCGPGFLLRVLSPEILPNLSSIHVGGALTDCWIFEKAMEKWPKAHIHQVYGSTEAEPVSMVDVRVSVQLSREAGYFQALCLGRPVPEIEYAMEPDRLWITGPHVCKNYLGNEEENKLNKRADDRGVVWHNMGDRIRERDGHWWFCGREKQGQEDFEIEQKVYALIQSSAAFVARSSAGRLVLYGNAAYQQRHVIAKNIPQIEEIIATKIRRDPRHRARIDRVKSQKVKRWTLG